VIGPESIRAAEAAACANEQGQFWPYHDTIFANQRGENQGYFNDDALKAFAAALGLDEAAFNDCLDADRYRDKVQAETAAGQERGVRSTPTLFINGELVEGAIPFEQLQSLIEVALNNSASE
jgi:protein-disulfide isomerase